MAADRPEPPRALLHAHAGRRARAGTGTDAMGAIIRSGELGARLERGRRMSRWSETREWLRGALFSRRVRAETREEMRFHLEMEAAERARVEGIDAAEARRQAMIAFGGEDKHVEAVREARGLAWLSGLSLDMKLGARMLMKYP